MDTLALIRQGVKLRKPVPRKDENIKKVDDPNKDPSQLSTAEILEKVAQIRDAVKESSSDESSSDESTSTW